MRIGIGFNFSCPFRRFSNPMRFYSRLLFEKYYMVESYHYVFISSEDDFTKFGANLIIVLPPGIALKFITSKYL